MIDLCQLPLEPPRFFSCELEQILWLVRHQEEPPVRCWWMAFEFAQKGRTFERIVFEIKHNPDVYISGESYGK